MVNGQSTSTGGHRTVAHAADVTIEAWDRSPLACLEEAARALVESFADVDDALATDTVPIVFDTAPDEEEALVAVLEEIIYLVDVLGVVAVDAALEETEDGGVAGYFETAPAARVGRVGAAPKGVSRSGLEFRADDGQWRCRAVIDV